MITLGYYLEEDTHYVVYKENGTNGDIIIPDYYDDGINGEFEVLGIEPGGTFSNIGNPNLGPTGSVILNSFIQYIPPNTFQKSVIGYLNLGNVKNIGPYAFQSGSLENVNFGNVEHIQPYAFKSCGIGNMQINYGLKTIGDFAFSGVQLYANIGDPTFNLPNSVTDIGNYAFKELTLEDVGVGGAQPNVILPQSLENIGVGCFQGSIITGVNLTTGVNVGESAFENCLTLTTATNINKTSKNMFLGCQSLQNISFGTECTGIGVRTFHSCSSLKKVNFKNTKISLIDNNAFGSCSNLIEINLENTIITNYMTNPFTNCLKLTNITMPRTLQELGMFVFSNNTAFTRINFLDNAPQVSFASFNGSRADLKLYRKKDFVTGWSTTLGGGFGQPSRPVFLWSDNVVKSGGTGKLSTKKKYLYIATGTGLSPNINGLRFYDSNLRYANAPSYYSEDGQYAIWRQMAGQFSVWIIGSVGSIGTFPSSPFWGWNSIFLVRSDYPPINGASGTLAISEYFI